MSCSYTNEFLSQAVANFTCGLGFGWNSYFAVADTNLMRRAGGKSRRSAILLCCMMLCVCVVPPLVPALAIAIPNTLVGALFAYIGFAICKGCLVDDRSSLELTEYVLAVLICCGCVHFGILKGMMLG